jgi:hypothetical protein
VTSNVEHRTVFNLFLNLNLNLSLSYRFHLSLETISEVKKNPTVVTGINSQMCACSEHAKAAS